MVIETGVFYRLWRIFLYVTVGVGALLVLSPFLMMISMSLTQESQVAAWPPRLIPNPLQFSNYPDAFISAGLGRYFLNSLIVSVSATVSAVVFDSLAGYAFAKMRFPGRGALFAFILATTMIPVQVTIIPLFIMFRRIPFLGDNDMFGVGGTGLINTYWPLIIPFMASTFGTYLMREFFRMIPSGLMDAARVDGASELRIFWKIYLPLAKPALATIALFSFTFSWNEFLFPLIMTSKPELRTLQLGLTLFNGQYFTQWDLMMAATVMVTLPTFIVFFLGQRYFIKGIAMTGIRG
jgi:multiple sugar transport system permease protein